MSTTLKDRIYQAQDIVVDAVNGVAQSWTVDLASFTTDSSDPTWTSPGSKGSRTGWFKLTVPYTMTVEITYDTGVSDAASYIGIFSWDGITSPVEVATTSLSSLTHTFTTGAYLIGFSLERIDQIGSSSYQSWSDVASASVSLPGTASTGDMLLAFVHLVGKNPAATITPPAGWTLEHNHDFPARPGDSMVFRSALYSTRLAADHGPYSFGLSPSTGVSVALISVTDIDYIGAVDFTEMPSYVAPTGADGIITTGSVSVTGPGVIVADFMHSTWGPGTFSTASTMTEIVDVTGYYIQQAVDTLYTSSTGTLGSYTSTFTPDTAGWLDAGPAHGSFLVSLREYTTTVAPVITITASRSGLLTMGVMKTRTPITIVEPFYLGSFLFESEEPFTMEADALVIESEELFDIDGAVKLISVEGFQLGETLLLDIEEPFTIINGADSYLGDGSPASPYLGWKRRSLR